MKSERILLPTGVLDSLQAADDEAPSAVFSPASSTSALHLYGGSSTTSSTGAASQSKEHVPQPRSRRVNALIHDYSVVKTGIRLAGFQVYCVEQWLVDRQRLTPGLVVYTGGTDDVISVDVLEPTETRSDGMSDLESSLRSEGGRPKQTSLGLIFVTSLANLQGDRSLVSIPGGQVTQQIRDTLYQNLALRRLGLGGRSSLSLTPPATAQLERFAQLYRLPYSLASVQELENKLLDVIAIVQCALALFGLGPLVPPQKHSLSHHQALPNEGIDQLAPDGLLCEETIAGLAEWNDIFNQQATSNPASSAQTAPAGLTSSSQIMTPSTLAGLLTIVASVRAKVHALGYAHPPKDPFVSRHRFLSTYTLTIQALGHQGAQVSHAHQLLYLTPPGIAALKRTVDDRKAESMRVGKMLRNRIDDIADRGLNPLSRTDPGAARNAAENIEDGTFDLDLAARSLNQGAWSEVFTLASLWSTTAAKRRQHHKRTSRTVRIGLHRHGRGSTAHLSAKDGYTSNDATSDTDAEAAHRLPGRVLRGFHDRTARAFASNADHSRGPSPHTTHQDPAGAAHVMTASDSQAKRDSEQQEDERPRAPVLSRALTDGDTEAYQYFATSYSDLPTKETSTASDLTRRHSLSHLCELNGVGRTMSPHSMKLDIDLQHGYTELRAKELEMQTIIEGLEAIDKSYGEAIQSFELALTRRREAIESLEEEARKAIEMMRSVFTSNSAIATLSVGNERLRYASAILTDKKADIESFRDRMQERAGDRGTMQHHLRSMSEKLPSPQARTMIEKIADAKAHLYAFFGRSVPTPPPTFPGGSIIQPTVVVSPPADY
ncbi:hypothetical protein E5Q_01800 [Mixia osmundae IAM 14324]|uniref:STB6-like N-terminal domain-containing protein n=1 Tax=Mixia osmundae (strain CBS 9802 / IAM 14324 / JCM 22182 / KY 12970) TaxID=764103 RepID=G7DX47_MIXOS|nr:hypothetical protein E5Q_01800 [Mixia osmundae IAM 14324]